MGKTYVKNKDLGLSRLAGPFCLFFQHFRGRRILGKASSNAMVRAKKTWKNMPPEKKAHWHAVAKIAAKTRQAQRELLLGVKGPVAGQPAEPDEPVSSEGAEDMPTDLSFLVFRVQGYQKDRAGCVR